MYSSLLQWGNVSTNSTNFLVSYNISFTKFETPISITNDNGTQEYRFSIGGHDINGFYQFIVSSYPLESINRVWFAIGI